MLLSCEPFSRGDSCSIVCNPLFLPLSQSLVSAPIFWQSAGRGASWLQWDTVWKMQVFSVKASYHCIGSKRSNILEGKPEPFTHCSYKHQHLDFLTAKADFCSPCWHYAFKEWRRETQPQTHVFWGMDRSTEDCFWGEFWDPWKWTSRKIVFKREGSMCVCVYTHKNMHEYIHVPEHVCISYITIPGPAPQDLPRSLYSSLSN